MPCYMYVQLEHHNGGCTFCTTNFRNSVLEGNLSLVVVINNELLNPIQLDIETLSRHEIKYTCKFILSMVSWRVNNNNNNNNNNGLLTVFQQKRGSYNCKCYLHYQK